MARPARVAALQAAGAQRDRLVDPAGVEQGVGDQEIDLDLIGVPRQRRIERAAVQRAAALRLRQPRAEPARPAVQAEQRDVGVRRLGVERDGALQHAEAVVDPAVPGEPRRRGLDHVELAGLAQRRDPRARRGLQRGRRRAIAGPVAGPVTAVRGVRGGGLVANQLAVRQRPARRAGEDPAQQRVVVALRQPGAEPRVQRLRLLGIRGEDQIAEVLAQPQGEQAQRRHLERRGQPSGERARDPAARQRGAQRSVRGGRSRRGGRRGRGPGGWLGRFGGRGVGAQLGAIGRRGLGDLRPAERLQLDVRARLLAERRREHPHRGEQVAGLGRLEPAGQRAQPARREPALDRLVDLIARVAAGHLEGLVLAVARERVQPDRPRPRQRELQPDQLVAPGRAVERVARRRSRPRVVRREVAVLRDQRRRLGVVHREPGVALAGLDARHPEQQPGLGGVGRVGALDHELGHEERDAVRLAQRRHG